MTNIRDLTTSDAGAYRTLMARGLHEQPTVFRISEQDAGEPIVPFESAQADDFTLGAFSPAGELVGTVSFQRETRMKLRHKGTIYRMYVQASGKGIGRRLLQEAIRRASDIEGLEQITLTVVATNSRAKALYLSEGFESFALERNGLKIHGTYFDEEQMSLHLARRGAR